MYVILAIKDFRIILFLSFIFSIKILTSHVTEQWFQPREGVNIEYPQNGLFHDLCDVISWSQMAIREMANGDDDHDLSESSLEMSKNIWKNVDF